MKNWLRTLTALCLTAMLALGAFPALAEQTTDITWFLNVGVVPSTWNQDYYVMRHITEETGVTVTATTPADDADTKLNLMIFNGSLPDVITTTNATLIKDMIDAGLVWSVEEFFQTYLPDSHLLTSYPQDVKDVLVARDGGWYSIPSHIKSADNREIWGMNDATAELWLSTDWRENRGVIFNTVIMEQLGITEEELQTESGVLAALEKVKAANLTVDGASVIPLLADGNSFNGQSWTSHYGSVGTLTIMFGGMPVDAEGNWVAYYRVAPFRHAVKFLNTCAQRGYVDANQFTFDRAAREAACRSGRVFCFIGNTADTGFSDVVNNGFAWYTPGVILSDGGETPVLDQSSSVGTGWLQTFISKNTKNPEAVARFLDYMTSDAGLACWNYGEPGVDVEITADGLYKRTEEGSKKANNAAVTGVGAFWAFCNQNWDQKYMDPSTDAGIVPQCAYGANEHTYKYNSYALDNLPGGYMESNAEVSIITGEIKTYVQTELANIILTATDEDFDAKLDAMIAQLDALGLKTVEDYRNAAVQENYKTLGIEPIKPIN
ncbi:MAG: hypothetical protein ACI4OY_12085 [Aristaeellaceae bacterium]